VLLPLTFFFPFRNLPAHLLVLPPSEVERAAALLRSIGLNRQIKRVETTEDKIVYAGATHDAFVWLSKYLPVTAGLTRAAG
jgi:hypothetical protein